MAYRFYLVHWRHEDAEPEAIEEDGRNPEQDEEDADQDQGDDPEPYDEVHLLVNDVLGQDAEAVVVLLTSGSADVRDGAADLGRKDLAERVDGLLLLGPGLERTEVGTQNLRHYQKSQPNNDKIMKGSFALSL